MLIYSFITDYQAFSLRYKDNTTRDKNETKVGKQSANLGKNNEPIQNRLSFLIDCKSVTLHHLTILSFPMVRPAWDNWWLLVVAVANSPKHDFNRCKSTTCKFFPRIFIRRELYILYTSILFRSFSFMTLHPVLLRLTCTSSFILAVRCVKAIADAKGNGTCGI